MKPIDVEQKDTQTILSRLYKKPKKHKKRRIKKRGIKVGDLVRITKFRKTFKKESEVGWTEEIFIVKQVRKTNPVTYTLQDLLGEDILGGFYWEEVQKIG